MLIFDDINKNCLVSLKKLFYFFEIFTVTYYLFQVSSQSITVLYQEKIMRGGGGGGGGGG